MANTIRHKRGTTTPGAGSLVTGELAINTSTGAVFTKTDGGTVVNIAGSATASWGGISGTLSSQTDLNDALALKANLAGATFTGKLNTLASSAAGAGFNLSPGANPSAPVNGDVWVTTGGALAARLNGATFSFVTSESNQTVTGNKTFSSANLTFGNSVTTGTVALASGATISGNTKTVNIATAGVSGSTTLVNVGSSVSGATSTINLNGTVNAPGLANGVKAWVNFNGTGTVAIRGSYNVSSITDNGAGDYTVNLTNALADTNYAVFALSNWDATARGGLMGVNALRTKTTSAVHVSCLQSANYATLDTSEVNVTVLR